MNAQVDVLDRIEAAWGAESPEYAAAAEMARRARCWDSLQEARRLAHQTPAGEGWKKVADAEGLLAGVRSCRAELGLSLSEARDCVEGYLNSRIGAD